MKLSKIVKNKPKDQEWDLIIEPKRSWWDLRLGQLWRSRDLIMLLVWRDYIAAYKQTILGPLWHILQPLMTTLIFTVIFGRIGKLPTDGLPDTLFYMTGTVLWTYFANCLTKTSNIFVINADLFGKVYFPRLAIPIAKLISNLIAFAIQLAVFLVILVYFILSGSDVKITSWALLLPALIIQMAGLGLGIGILISSLTTKYRDLTNLVGFGVQLWMYVTIIIPASTFPEEWRWLINLNPLTPIVEVFRYAFLGAGSASWGGLVYSLVFMLVVLTIGVLIFNRVETTFMDTV